MASSKKPKRSVRKWVFIGLGVPIVQGYGLAVEALRFVPKRIPHAGAQYALAHTASVVAREPQTMQVAGVSADANSSKGRTRMTICKRCASSLMER